LSTVQPNKRNKVLGFIAVTLALLVGGAGWWWIHSSKIVNTDDARVKGTIVAVSSRVSGRIEAMLVNEGDEVAAGQIIAKIETKELEVQVAQAKANLAAANAKLAGTKAGNRPQQIAQAAAATIQATANLNNAEKAFERAESLYQRGAISAQQRDTAQTSLSVARAQYEAASQSYSLTVEGTRPEDIEAAEAQVEQAMASLKSAEIQLENAVIKAPITGTIAVRAIRFGESVNVGQTIVNIVNLNDVWVSANIDERKVGLVRVGQTVDFEVDAYPSKTFCGEVMEVGAATGSQFSLLPTENTSGNYTKVVQKIPVKIKAARGEGAILKPGMSAIINIRVKA
jgi:membrane fusion protein, multidrug efflux system